MTRSFNLDAPSLLEDLKNSVGRLKDDDLNEDLARDCACKAWHLCDHIFKAVGPNPRFTSLKELQDHVRNACPELAYLQDICIESKHGEITRYEPHIEEAHHHRGGFSKAFSRGFDISRLEIKLLGGQTVFFLDVVNRAVGFWSDFVKSRAPAGGGLRTWASSPGPESGGHAP